MTITAVLLLGITVTTRILRLAKNLFWEVLAFMMWAGFVALFALIVGSGPTVHA